MSKWNLLDDLSDQNARIKEMESYLGPMVVQARLAGASWPQIGEALGVSRQAVIAKYGHMIPEPSKADDTA